MEIKIKWNDKNFDVTLDKQFLEINQETGNKGLGFIVLAMCSVAIFIPTYFTIKQMLQGTASGNPVGALAALFLFLGLPTYWGFRQFFLRRVFYFNNGVFYFTLISPFKRKKHSISTKEFERIEFGKKRSRSSEDAGIGSIGNYFVRLPHKNDRFSILLFNNVKNQMAPKRLQAYSKLLNLPIVDITPEQTAKDKAFQQKIAAFLEKRKTNK